MVQLYGREPDGYCYAAGKSCCGCLTRRESHGHVKEYIMYNNVGRARRTGHIVEGGWRGHCAQTVIAGIIYIYDIYVLVLLFQPPPRMPLKRIHVNLSLINLWMRNGLKIGWDTPLSDWRLAWCILRCSGKPSGNGSSSGQVFWTGRVVCRSFVQCSSNKCIVGVATQNKA